MTAIQANDNDFDKIIKEQGDKLVLVDFYADWCMPCKMLGPIIEKSVEKRKDKVVLVKVNVDKNPQKSEQYEVSGIPSVKLLRKGKIVDEFVGYKEQEAIDTIIEKNLK